MILLIRAGGMIDRCDGWNGCDGWIFLEGEECIVKIVTAFSKNNLPQKKFCTQLRGFCTHLRKKVLANTKILMYKYSTYYYSMVMPSLGVPGPSSSAV